MKPRPAEYLWNVLSLGGGVQSTALFLMALHGEFEESVEAAIFADPGAEHAATYKNIEFLREYASGFGVPVYTVSDGNLKTYSLQKRGTLMPVAIPFYVRNPAGKKGMLRRQCTNKFKVRPILRKLRELGATKENPICQWIGISVEEASRMKPSRVKYATHRYPLVERRLGRDSCYAWLDRNGFPEPSRSSCTFCPYHTDAEWRRLTESELAEVAAFERECQAFGLGFMDEEGVLPFLHRSLKPISERPFNTVSEDQMDFLESEVCDAGCFT